MALAPREHLDGCTGAGGLEEEVLQVGEDMARPAVHHDGLAPFGEVLRHALLGIQFSAQLVDAADLQPAAVGDAAGRGLQPARQQAQQRGLARAVGADDADTLALEDAQVEPPDNRRLAGVGEAEAVYLERQRARALAGLKLHAADALLQAALAEGLAQLEQRAHAALVAGAAGAHPLAQPGLLLVELTAQALPCHRLVVQKLLLALQEGVVVAIPARQAAAVEIDDAAGQPAQEGAVVGDEEERLDAALQEVLQPLDGVEVEVVGGLVQQQEVRTADQRARQHGTAAQSARELFQARGGVETEPRHDGVRRRRPFPRLGARMRHHPRLDDLAHAPMQVSRQLLRQVGHPQARLAQGHAAIRLDQARQQAQQRGLARAVASREAGTLPPLDVQIHVIQNRVAAHAERDILKRDESHAGIRG